ncbi:DUF2398 family protein [Streptacidiphilus griseoplanus]|uniref:DUF2398 family protein n=1 Tax=Peterkaempfera griseoplana TaxID=66896 RepID=UPI0006E186A4|nr:DUF2398 family protein [Peterkaempfera griseoplana]
MDEYGQPGNVMQLTGPASGTTADDLRRLARWFDASTPGQAHDLFAAAFGLYGARHLGTVPGPGAAPPAHTSWWHGPAAGPAPLPAALRVQTAPRGRALPAPGVEPPPARAVAAPRHARPLRPAADGAEDDTASGERRAAARLLLAHPLITATGPWAAGLPQIRRHSDALAQRFDRLLGYRLEVDEHAARLFKAGLGTGCGRGLRGRDGAPFTPGAYTALVLVLATLPDLPGTPTLRELHAEVRSAASATGLQTAAEEAPLAAALAELTSRQVIGDAGEGRLLVHHAVARLLPAGPLAEAADGADLVRRAADPGPGGERTYVRRRLAENPVVLLDELTPRERGWLRTRQRREAETFADFLGLEAEIRAEGVALLDPADELSDLDPCLPGAGVLARAALLLAERLVEQLRPVPGDAVSRTAAGPVIGVPVPDAAIDGVLGDVADEYGGRPGWPAGYLADRAALRRDVLDLLHRMQLMAPAGPVRADEASVGVPQGASGGAPGGGADEAGESAAADVRGARGEAVTGWVLLAPAARYAPGAQAVPARPGRHARTTAGH